MRKVLFSVIFTTALLLMPLCASAQSRDRSYIREYIEKYGECRNVSITKYNGDVMLYGRNGWASTGCPQGLSEALHSLNESKESIRDVQLTENGSWLILYGTNGIRWSGIPYDLECTLRQYNSDQEDIKSVTFNDDGDWIVIAHNYFSASDEAITQWISEGCSMYGTVWSACVTDDACVVVYQNGFKFIGDIPASLKTALKEAPFDVYRVKIAGDAWFISDDKTRYSYNM